MIDLRPNNVDILYKVMNGDEEAFSKLCGIYRNNVLLFVLRLTKSNTFAEDLTQEVFIKIWAHRSEINPQLHFGAFIKKISQNHVLNFLKKAALNQNIQKEIYSNIVELKNNVDEQMHEKELQRIYLNAIEQLPKQKKIIFLLSRRDYLTHEEIAEQLQLSRNTVKNHMVEALRFIRSYITNRHEFIFIILAYQFLYI